MKAAAMKVDTMAAGRIMEGRAYRLRPCPGGSDRYGACEICGGHVETTYHLVALRRFWSQARDTHGLSHISNTFGHKDCLAATTYN